jgi:hypothetical protein
MLILTYNLSEEQIHNLSGFFVKLGALLHVQFSIIRPDMLS